mgnify:CR=1 FL=1
MKYKQVFKNGKVVTEHRYLMEKHLKRKLRTDEDIHHINGNGLDNRIKNLMITNLKEHPKYHKKLREIKMSKVMTEYISTEKLAEIYGVCEEVARRWCRKGKVDCKKINGRWYIKKDKENKDEQ